MFLESLDFTSLHNLKVLFVCENNRYSVYSPIKNRQSKERQITKISKAIGIESKKFSNHDILELENFFKITIDRIRSRSKPFLVEVDTYRYLEHCGPNNDDNLLYRNTLEINKWKSRDQIKKLENFLIKNKVIDNKINKKIKQNIEKKIDAAFNFAEKSEYPSIKLLGKYIYAQ